MSDPASDHPAGPAESRPDAESPSSRPAGSASRRRAGGTTGREASGGADERRLRRPARRRRRGSRGGRSRARTGNGSGDGSPAARRDATRTPATRPEPAPRSEPPPRSEPATAAQRSDGGAAATARRRRQPSTAGSRRPQRRRRPRSTAGGTGRPLVTGDRGGRSPAPGGADSPGRAGRGPAPGARRRSPAPAPAPARRRPAPATAAAPAAAKPKIGDSRPAPARRPSPRRPGGTSPSTTGRRRRPAALGTDGDGGGRRRRRRGGRARSATGDNRPVEATGRRAGRGRRRDARAPAGPGAQGPAGRPLPDGRPRQARRHPDRRARGPGPDRALRVPARPTTSTRSTATSTSAGSRTSCPAWRRRSSTSARPRTPCSTGATSATTRTRSRPTGPTAPTGARRPAAGATVPPGRPHRAAAQAGPDHRLPGHQEPDRHQGGPPDPGGVAARPVRGADPQQRHLRHLQAAGRRRAQAAAPDPRRRPPRRPRPDRADRGRGGHRRRAAPRRGPAACTSGSGSTPLAKRSRAPALLYREPDMAVRVIREEFNKDYRGVVIDDRALYEEVRDYVASISPELADRVEYAGDSDDPLPVFERYHVHEQLHKALDRKVWLPSGGSLIIERTEALTVIDVNTGKNVGHLQPGGDRLPQQPGGGRGDRPPAAAPRHRRHHRHRLHRHGDRRQPGRGHPDLPRRPGPGQDPDPGLRHLRAGPGRDDPQAGLRGPGRVVLRDLPDVRRPRASSSTSRCCEPLGLATDRVASPSYVCSDQDRWQAGAGRRGPAGGRRAARRGRRRRGHLRARAAGRRRDGAGRRRPSWPAASVSARVVGETKGPKIHGFTYKTKTRGRRRWGHRQKYTTIEITGISRGEG